MALARRSVLGAVALAGAGLVLASPACRAADRDIAEHDLVVRLFGRSAEPSPRVRLEIPDKFANGFSVPMTLSVGSPMSEGDHTTAVTVIAPANPIVVVARFGFTTQSGLANVTTRIRLSKPQNVIAVAEMSDGSLLMASRWVSVETDGCS